MLIHDGIATLCKYSFANGYNEFKKGLSKSLTNPDE